MRSFPERLFECFLSAVAFSISDTTPTVIIVRLIRAPTEAISSHILVPSSNAAITDICKVSMDISTVMRLMFRSPSATG